ncbi:TB2/DP1, HVA22 family-domain-containing protein [Circinella umbellata]|nr:TB2/DP1, HVA22 family-domain-containing protein [Circinella umbellata]
MSESHYVEDKNIHNERTGGDFRFHATSSAIEQLLDTLNRQSPINLEFITRPLNKAFNSRVYSLETIYAKSRIFRLLVRKGVNPILLFVSLTAGMAGGLRRFYKQSTQLALNLLGVVYPAWKCWQLVKEQSDQQQQPLDGVNREREYKSWLTYWMIYGTFQVLDNWTYDILSIFPNYNVYKLAILYWLQSPHSKGAFLLCHQVIQKPSYPDSSACSSSSPTPTASYSIPSTPESNHADDDDNDDPLTLTIEPPKSSANSTPSILDGYTPTLQPRTPPSIIATNTITTEKQDQPYSLLEAEAAW